MCGIAGCIAPNLRDEAMSLVRAMLPAMERRGPDSEGVEAWDSGAVLGHRRLAILDLSPAGHQPMLNAARDIGVVFNGCIYNFLDIRKELEDAGHCFRSNCDTEVLVRGYEEWGIDKLVRKLRGMYAFGVWDERQRKLTLVRDRLGVKPLLYSEQSGCIAFASTIQALRAAQLNGSVRPSGILSFLEFGYVTEEQCAYEGISKLPPATIGEWKDGKWTERVYWELPSQTDASISFEDAVAETERLLLEAVRLRLISDVPIGALLSGGIDSALVCWAMREANARVSAFTVGAPGDPSDETADSRETARILGIPHEVVTLPSVKRAPLESLGTAWGEPFACYSALGMLAVSEAVKGHATVLLTGDGGDDVFLGYPFFAKAWTAEKLARKLPNGVAAMWPAMRWAVPEAGGMKRLRNFLNYSTEGLAGYARAHDGLQFFERAGALGERLAPLRLMQRHLQPSSQSARNLLREVFHYHRQTEFTAQFMPKVDGATMHYSLEARAPFLDQALWEFAAKLPPEILFHGGGLKAVLREIVRRRISPQVADRKKQGFTIPVERLLATEWRGDLERLPRSPQLKGWIDGAALEAPIREGVARQYAPEQLWNALVLDHWLAGVR